MTDTPEHLTKRLLEEGEKTIAFFRALPPGQWEVQVYAEGMCWNVQQVLAHFVSTENSLARLVANIQAGGAGAPVDFNIDAYNERKVAELRAASTAELIDRFAAQRRQTADLVARLQPEDLSRAGRHPFLGVAPLEEIIKLIYRHNGIHLRDVRKVIKV